eukprot:8273132-Alexandrium_andersonii.AAC.1
MPPSVRANARLALFSKGRANEGRRRAAADDASASSGAYLATASGSASARALIRPLSRAIAIAG